MDENVPRKPTRPTNRAPSARKTPAEGTKISRTKKSAPPQPPSAQAAAAAAQDATAATLSPADAASERPATPSEPRIVFCVKLGRELPGLARPPFPGALGQRIFEQISQEAWEMWQERSTLLINHYGLSLADPDARQIMRQQMEEFFFGQDARMPEGWVPESAGAKGKGAVAPRK